MNRWIPSSARFLLLGQSPKAKGVFKVMQLNKGKLDVLAEVNSSVSNCDSMRRVQGSNVQLSELQVEQTELLHAAIMAAI